MLSEIPEDNVEYSQIIPAMNPSNKGHSSRNSAGSPSRTKTQVKIEESAYQLKPEQTSPQSSNRNMEKPQIQFSLGPYETLSESNPPKFGQTKDVPKPLEKQPMSSPQPVKAQDTSRTTESQSSQILGGQFQDVIRCAKNPKKYQTGFECCVNIIPILPEYGYVNCAVGDQNSVAQYEVTEKGTIKQTEILKSSFISQFF